jgi:hypothetical protein
MPYPFKDDEDRWLEMEAIVQAWELRFPDKKAAAISMVASTQKSRANKFASDGTKDDMDLRLMLRLPASLWDVLKTLIQKPGPFHEAKELKRFMKRFPYYVVPEKT